MKTKVKTTNGFTLVEVLLGLAMAAIIIVGVYSMFDSAMTLDHRLQYTHNDTMKILLADEALTHDLENAISLDLSASYPEKLIFEGKPHEFSFLTQTRNGIKHIHYYTGPRPAQEHSTDECLMRQESSLADWLNETTHNSFTQMVAEGVKKGSFACRYAAVVKDPSLMQGISDQDSWDAKTLPAAVSCSFALIDSQSQRQGSMFKREVLLAPVTTP
jgi:prepilin-type N-terminal cleavage/methylation domain-containing protein